MIDPDGFAMYGRDAAEAMRTPGGVRQLMVDDFALIDAIIINLFADRPGCRNGAAASATIGAPTLAFRRRCASAGCKGGRHANGGVPH